ncbi:MAG: hypothetical protein PHE47_08600 [Oscillospiraceae bacterium]|nr:hypothetical protein [Oscillospiraceae bacterium]
MTAQKTTEVGRRRGKPNFSKKRYARCCPLCALAEEGGITLRVGYIDYQGFIGQAEDGSYTGYAVEYLDKISEYTGFRYE